MVLHVLLFLILVKEDPVDVIPFHAVEATKDVHHSFEHQGLVKRSRAWGASRSKNSGPSLIVKIELVDIIEALLVLIDSTEDEH